MDKKQERLILCKLIVTKMRRSTEIFGMLDHFKEHGTLGYSKPLAFVNTDDVDIKQLLFIQKNYPTYKARKLAKVNKETNPDKRKILMAEFELLSTQLDEARIKLKAL